jgi:predicted nucleic acid-binding protein
MPQRVFDTSVLIAQWRRHCHAPIDQYVAEDVVQWAAKLQQIHRASHVLTPVEIEFVAGVTNRVELRLARVFVDQFKNADEGKVLSEDWVGARKMAERIPRSGRPRQLGDCLIAAIAKRLKLEVITFDGGFPK